MIRTNKKPELTDQSALWGTRWDRNPFMLHWSKPHRDGHENADYRDGEDHLFQVYIRKMIVSDHTKNSDTVSPQLPPCPSQNTTALREFFSVCFRSVHSSGHTMAFSYLISQCFIPISDPPHIHIGCTYINARRYRQSLSHRRVTESWA